MSNPIEEKISSLIDNELENGEAEQLVKQVKQHASHQTILSRYCLIQEAMKKNLPTNPKHNLFDRVSSALESEPVLFAPNGEPRAQTSSPEVETQAQSAPVVAKPAIPSSFGWAAAAAIAVVAVVSSVNLTGTPETQLSGMDVVSKQSTQELITPVMSNQQQAPTPLLVTTSPQPLFQVPQVMPSDDQWERIDHKNSIQWETYIQEHSETASQGGVQPGVAPFARVVSFEGEGQEQ